MQRAAIEGSRHGVEAARRAGMCCIGVGPVHETPDAAPTPAMLANAGPKPLLKLERRKQLICPRPRARLYCLGRHTMAADQGRSL